MEVGVSSDMPQRGTFGDSFTPSWAQRRHTMGALLQMRRHGLQKALENTCENKRFEDFGLGRLQTPILKSYGLQLGPKLLPNGSKFL